MPEIQVKGAVVVPFESQGTRLNETIDGKAYTGQRYELSFFPQRGGRIAVPSVEIDIQISQWGSPPQQQHVQSRTPVVYFNVQIPPGAEDIRGLISTGQLTAEQQWEPDTDHAAVGDTVVRRIHLAAENVSAIAFAPLTFTSSDLYDAYPQEPNVQDQYNRGILTGRRSETVTYLFKRSGTVELPAFAIIYWDPESREMHKANLASRVIEVAPASAGNSSVSPTSASKGTSRYWIGALFAVPIFLAALFRKRLQARWTKWSQKRRNSEHRYFRQLLKAARTGHPVNTFNALMRWLNRIETGGRSAQLDYFLRMYADARTAGHADQLCRSMTGDDPTHWQSRALIKGLVRARRNWIVQQRKSEPSDRRLPQLNPGNT
jgi:hypothetical protein